jgi:primosomal replication protein N
MNRMVLSATLVERGVARVTPAGIVVCDFSLHHASEVSEAGMVRQVNMQLKGVAFGDIAKRLLVSDIGSAGMYAGFLSNQRNGRGAILHVTEFSSGPDGPHFS